MSSNVSWPNGGPRLHVKPRPDDTFGDLAADLAAAYGLAPDEWQQVVLDDWLAVRRGKWASLTCGISVPRQNGKNALIEVRELFGMVGRGEKILHTAHEVKTAQKHFRRLKHFFGERANDPGAKFPELNALVSSVRSVNGQEAVFLTNGGSIELVARSKNSGRGFTVDVLVMDEAQELSEDALEALMPTTAAAPLGDPQWIFAGTPPGPNAVGEVFTRVRVEALGAKPGRVCWHEWSPPDGHTDLDDKAMWRATNPAVAAGRLQMAVIEGERSRFSDDGFDRERRGSWPATTHAKAAFKPADWKARAIDPAAAPREGRVAFGVKYSVDGSHFALAVARMPESGVPHVELLRLDQMVVGSDGLVDFLSDKTRLGMTAEIVVDGKSGSANLADALHSAGVSKRIVRRPTVDEVVASYGMLLESVRRAGGLSHIGQEQLGASVEAVIRRPIGTAGGFGFESVIDGASAVPVEACALALHAVRTSKRRPGRKSKVVVS